MNFFDMLRDLPECHRFSARGLHSGGDHGVGQRARATSLMTGQQTAQAAPTRQACAQLYTDLSLTSSSTRHSPEPALPLTEQQETPAARDHEESR